MSLFLFLFTALTCVVGLLAEYRHGKKEEEILHANRLFTESAQINEKETELMEYREYIEAWVHEAKTPLALSALVLNNHRDEMSPYVYARMNYIQHRLNEDVERILFYARLQADHTDCKFTKFRPDECVTEVIAEYRTFLEEKNIAVSLDLKPLTVVSDRKVVFFMLSQLIDNAVKYADAEVFISMYQEGDKVHLGIYNNGDGVPPEDMPFIFDKGFTGNRPNRQKATGMGLYLVRKYAEKLCVEVKIDSNIPYENGFGIKMIFTL